MTLQQKNLFVRAAVLLAIALVGFGVWKQSIGTGNSKNLISGNGRIDAVEIDVAAMTPGRLKNILVQEGEFVTAGQVVATMDAEVLNAQLKQARAQLTQTQAAVATARSQLTQRQSERTAAVALVRQREAELENARKHAARSGELVQREVIPQH